jgi:ureidoglycolate hydrolase
MSIDSKLLTISHYSGPGYAPQIDFETWRIAILNYCEAVRPENIKSMQRHDQSDEVFVLLQGRCMLIIGVGDGPADKLYFEELQPLKLYNVKRGVWHNHVLSQDGSVLIVENQNTSDHNSPQIMLNEEQCHIITQSSGLFHRR